MIDAATNLADLLFRRCCKIVSGLVPPGPPVGLVVYSWIPTEVHRTYVPVGKLHQLSFHLNDPTENGARDIDSEELLSGCNRHDGYGGSFGNVPPSKWP